MTLSLLATCGFGLEPIVRDELKQMGIDSQIVSPGFVSFAGDARTICLTNLWLRTADRVLVQLAQFPCENYDVLYEQTEQCEWEQWIGADDKFPVSGYLVGTHHRSLQAAIKTVKRGIVQRLQRVYGIEELPETRSEYAIRVSLINDQAWLTLDTTGPSLHRRGYRSHYRREDLKETLAAALVLLSCWDRERLLIDPFCGSGTIIIEAAMIGCRIAPGRNRAFASEAWHQIDQVHWEDVRREADEGQLEDLPNRLVGYDIDERCLRTARESAIEAGVEDSVHFQPSDFRNLKIKRKYGVLLTNPPWFEPNPQIGGLYRELPEVLRKLPTWSHFILTDHPTLERNLGREADRRRKLYNERRSCTLYSFYGPKPNEEGRIAFGALGEKEKEQAELLQRRLVKRARHLRKWPVQKGITCYRLYERDIPEIPLVIDRYGDCLHITEYERPHDRDPATHANWLELLAASAGEILQIDKGNVFLKRRQRQSGNLQYERQGDENREFIVREGDLQFVVNLSDFVDTGLFLDHRVTRSMVREEAAGKRFLNLFAYTGSFSVYAAAGAAKTITTVDWNNTYLRWAERNMELNGFQGDQYQFVREDSLTFVENLPTGELFDLVVVDPPTFSNSKRTTEIWEVQTGYVQLLNTVLDRMPSGGVLYFSNNFRRFKFDSNLLRVSHVHEISNQTVPTDFRNRRIHRCWRMVR